MSDLEVGYTKFVDIHSAWKNKVAAADAEKAVALEQLKSVAEREAKLQEEVFRLTDDFVSSGPNLSQLTRLFQLLSCRSRARSTLSTSFDGSEINASRNSKPNVDIIGPA